MEEYGKPPAIICDICDKPVDKLIRHDNPVTNKTVFSAICHGRQDDVSLSLLDLYEARSIFNGRAFRQRPQLKEDIAYSRK